MSSLLGPAGWHRRLDLFLAGVDAAAELLPRIQGLRSDRLIAIAWCRSVSSTGFMGVRASSRPRIKGLTWQRIVLVVLADIHWNPSSLVPTSLRLRHRSRQGTSLSQSVTQSRPGKSVCPTMACFCPGPGALWKRARSGDSHQSVHQRSLDPCRTSHRLCCTILPNCDTIFAKSSDKDFLSGNDDSYCLLGATAASLPPSSADTTDRDRLVQLDWRRA